MKNNVKTNKARDMDHEVRDAMWKSIYDRPW